jgi:hypothetical protein
MASSIVSPEMNRDAARRANAHLVTRLRAQLALDKYMKNDRSIGKSFFECFWWNI